MPPGKANTDSLPAPRPGETDEQYARRLQCEYDEEYARRLQREYEEEAAGRPLNAAGSSGDKDDEICVVCRDKPCEAGFVHGDSVHKCCCKDCAMGLKETGYPTCPLCRRPIEHFILVFY